MRSVIWPAVLARLKGRALAFRILIHSPSAVVSSSGGQNTPRSRRRRCSGVTWREYGGNWHYVTRHWRFAFSRRSRRSRVSWERMSRLAGR
jgi:hypothetical protein